MAEHDPGERDRTPGGSTARPGVGPANRLWIERMSTALGFDRLAANVLDRPGTGPYLFLGTVLFVHIPVLVILNYQLADTYRPLNLPGSVVIAVGLVFGLWAMRRMRDRYEAAVDELGIDGAPTAYQQPPSTPARLILRFATSDDVCEEPAAALEELVASRFKLLVLVVLWGSYVLWLVFNPSGVNGLLQNGHPVVNGVGFFLIIPLVYYPMFADFLGAYGGTLLLLPLKVRAIGYIDFQDELGYGGLSFIGDLGKSATIYYFVALSAYVVLQLLSEAFGAIDVVGYVIWNAIGIGVGVGVALFFLPVAITHGHMKHAKHRRIREIADEIKAHGPDSDDQMFPDTAIPTTLDDGHAYLHYYVKLRRLESTREYPIDVSHIQEMMLAAVVPYVAHVTVTFLLAYAGSGH